MKKRSGGFTLVEILVVLAIIAILAALLFPAFNSARERSRQTSCQTNLQQISLAVQLYHNDFRRYPDTLLDLLGEGAKFDDGTATGNTLTSQTATGYLKGGADSLVCPDDDTLSDKPRSSYGALTKIAPAAVTDYSAFTGDYGQYVWNYWGVDVNGFTYPDAVTAATKTWKVSGSHASPGTAPATAVLLADPTHPFNSPADPADYDPASPINTLKYSLANRFAPPSMIITHCVYHRLPTANNLSTPGLLYATPEDSKNCLDAVLRLDGSVKVVDVSTWKDNSTWQKQTP